MDESQLFESRGSGWAMPEAADTMTIDDALARQRLYANLLEMEALPIRVGRFRIEGRLGEGGMGTLWAAHDEELLRPVALKFLRNRSHTNPRVLIKEAQSLAKINHPNVVAVYDVGAHQDRVWIAMELVAGQNLRKAIGSEVDTGRDARLQWWLEAGKGIAALHAIGLIHRDIKPDNVLLGMDGRVRLVDFGLVCTSSSAPALGTTLGGSTIDDESSAAMGGAAGTYAYAAPEQLRGDAKLDARADQFAFCVSLWEALCGTRPEPFEPDLSRRPPEMSRRIYRALVRGMSQSPDDRFPEMQALLAELEPRRRRWLIPALVSAGLAGLLGFGLRPDATVPDPCATADAAVDEHWNSGRRAVFQAHFERAGAPWVRQAIDTWVVRWADTARASCQQSMVFRNRSPQVHDRRMACLDRRLDRLAALTGAIEENVETHPRIELSILGPWLLALRAPEACLETDMSDGGPAAVPPAFADEVRGLRQRLAAAEFGEVGISLYEHLSAARAVEARAKELAWPPLQGDAARVIGLVHQRGGEAVAARDAYGRALDLAREANDQELEADAWTGLVAVARDLELDLDRADWALLRRSHLVEKLDVPHQHARLLAERGLLMDLSGKYEAAQALLEEADAQFREIGTLAAWEHAGALRDLANVQMRRGASDEALASMSRARSLELELRLPSDAFKSGQQPSEARASLFNQGLAQLEAGDLQMAQTSLTQAHARFVDEQGPRGRDVVRALLGLTAVADARGDLKAARARSEQARRLAPVAFGPFDRERADVLSAVGTVAYREHRYKDAAEAFDRVLGIHAHLPVTDAISTALATSNLAEALVGLGKHRRARLLLEPALALLEQRLGAEHPDLAYPLKALGAAQLGLANAEAAAVHLARAQALFGESRHSPELAETRWLTAQAAWENGNPSEARAAATQAHEMYERLGPLWATAAAEIKTWLQEHPETTLKKR